MIDGHPEHSTKHEGSHGLRRDLKNRHIQLMAIGGAIGTGLFMGSGKSISLAGPSIMLVYIIIGFFLFFVMRAMGELLLSNLSYKSFSDFTDDLLGPMAGFFTGWTYWFCWVVTGIADVVAISSYVSFWFPDLSPWVSSFAIVVALLLLNLMAVKAFGETEFWFAMIKIVTIIALVVVGFIMVALHFQAPDGHQASLSNLWTHQGFFPNGVLGFFAGFQIAVFAFVGIELVGTAAAETENPQKNLPRAINAIPIRIIIFYVLALMAIMCVTPWDKIVADRSPFVEMFLLAGLPAAAGIINFVVLTSAASSANSGIFSTSRMLYGLSQNRQAPKLFGSLSDRMVPSSGLFFTCICLFFGVVLIYLIPNVMAVFTIVTTISAVLFIFVWTMILCAYLVYRRRYPERHQASLYKMPMGLFMSWAVLAFFVFVLILLTLKDDTRMALMTTPIWFIVLAISWLFIRRDQARR